MNHDSNNNLQGGGWPAIRYALSIANRVGWPRLWKALRSKNACKTCALGMGGQKGGMTNEAGRWPEVCKKSLQAMAADMQDGIRDEFFANYSLAQMQGLSPRELESLGRLVRPLYAGPGDTHYHPISWDQALRRIIDKLKHTFPQEAFFYASGRASNEAAFLLQLFARCWGTNHVNNCSYYCHQASGVGLSQSIGTGTATVDLEDVENADCFFLIGGNPASNHPRLMRTLVNIRRRGGQVIVINPVREPGLVRFRVPSDLRSLLFGSDIATLYVQPHIGGDIALLTGVAKSLVDSTDPEPAAQARAIPANAEAARRAKNYADEERPRPRIALDRRFIADHTEGWDDYRRHLESTDWATIEQASGVDRATINEIAAAYAAAKNAVFGWTMGITHHLHGVQNVQTIVNLALMRGMIGRPHAGLLPIRGHSNVQGVGSVGVTPALKPAIRERLEAHFGIELPTTPGHDTLACLEAADRGDMRFAWCLGGNLYGATPDAAFTARAMGKIDMIVYLNTTLNIGHAHARGKETLILPVLARDEESQATTQESMFSYVRLSDGGPPRHTGPRSEVSVIADVAEALIGKLVGPDVTPPSEPIAVRASSLNESTEGRSGQYDTETSETDPVCHCSVSSGEAGDGIPLQEHFNRKQGSLLPIDWSSLRSHERLRNTIAAVIPGLAKLSAIDRTRREFQIDGRTFHTPSFPTPTGRARFYAHSIPDLSETNGRLRLMTVRSEGQFNTVVYEEEDVYRGQDRRDVILLHSRDMQRLNLETDQPVTVRSDVGTMNHVRIRPFDIRPGNALMYFPEANVLIPTTSDPQSRTPAYKSVLIEIVSQPTSPSGPGVRLELPVNTAYQPRRPNAC